MFSNLFNKLLTNSSKSLDKSFIFTHFSSTRMSHRKTTFLFRLNTFQIFSLAENVFQFHFRSIIMVLLSPSKYGSILCFLLIKLSIIIFVILFGWLLLRWEILLHRLKKKIYKLEFLPILKYACNQVVC